MQKGALLLEALDRARVRHTGKGVSLRKPVDVGSELDQCLGRLALSLEFLVVGLASV